MSEPGADEIEEFVPEPSTAGEDYDPEVEIEDPTREADPADVNDQYAEVPELVEDEAEEEPEL